ncbi:bacteriophage abortive infection AbiH family protein [Pseudoalteromonas sp. T1lg65]|uniref:bacteriophage abortive infection AbiH family protein n=1 Tax=Pseudoalteromonas sp. T1lg65 TaxID=2077101 RepID=UPI003F791600
MNILYFIGNGFDLKLNLKTSYKDFLNSYKRVKNESPIIAEFKNEIGENYLDWSDLEANLGKYTEQLDSATDFEEIHSDLIDELANYLTEIQTEFVKTKLQRLDKKKFITDLFSPEVYSETSHCRLLDYYNSSQKNAKNLSIITFNYTNTIESILGIETTHARYENVLTKCQPSSVAESQSILNVLHLHGTLEENMVLGVDNIEQVLSKKFRNIEDVAESIVKPLCNRVSAHAIDQDCVRLLNQAHLICIFGSSIGVTDQTWWKLIANQVKKRDCRLIVFMYEPNLNRRRL